MRHSIYAINILAILLVNLLAGCGARPYFSEELRKLNGAYAGSLENGKHVNIALSKQDKLWTGIGNLGNRRFVFVEDASQRVVGNIFFSDGTMKPAAIRSSSDGKAVMRIDSQTIELDTRETIFSPATSPFSGYYETKDARSLMNAIYLTQSGNVIGGNAMVMGNRVLINGWTQSENKLRFRGYAILPDGVQIEFEAGLKGKNKLIVSGIGKPVTFRRKEV